MNRWLVVLALGCVVSPSKTKAQIPPELRGTTVVGRAVSAVAVIGGKPTADSPSYEIVWEIQDSGIVRRSLRNMSSNHVETDDTFYRWLFVGNRLGFRPEALRFVKSQTEDTPSLFPFVQAVGQPGMAAIDVLSIGPSWVQSVQISGRMVSIEFYRRTQ